MSDFDGITPRLCAAWEQQDLEAVLEYIHRDILYSMFIPEDVVPFGGETRGKAAMTDRLKTILEQFAMAKFETILFRRDGNTEYTRVAYEFRHRLTGETIAGVMRIITRIDNGLIHDWKEFHDLEMVKAFMRLIAYKASET